MIPTINKPTRVTRQIACAIDYIITNSIMRTGFKLGIIKTDISDHFPTFFCQKYIAEKEDAKARLENMLVCGHPGLFFRVHPADRKNFFYQFETENNSINIYNIFVTKKTFFWNEYQKKFMTRTSLVDPDV